MVTKVTFHSCEINKLINNHSNSLTCRAYLVICSFLGNSPASDF